MLYKDLIEYVQGSTTLSKKEVKLVLSKVKIFIKNCIEKETPFKWKGLMSLKVIKFQATRKVLKGEVINVPAKTKVKVTVGK